MLVKMGIGQDSHAFSSDIKKPLSLGGVIIKGHPGFKANSDGDVILHAITNAISSLTGHKILGQVADDLCAQGQTDSRIYLKLALESMAAWQVSNVAVSIEALKPKLAPHLSAIEQSVAKLLKIAPDNVGITVTSGEGLTSFGLGKGIQAIAAVTLMKNQAKR